MNNKKVALIILDGWGNGNKTKSDAIYNAKTPFVDSIEKDYPTAELLTDGENVGLPKGQMGNSEVGHLNIGAGRVVFQDLVKINNAIKDKTIKTNKNLLKAYNYAKENKVNVHLMGLVSKGGVHSSQEHLYALCDIAKEVGLPNFYIHAFTDGRDCDPKSGLSFINELENYLQNSCGEIASVVGRYYAMDRDKRWERIKLAYDLLVFGKGTKFNAACNGIKEAYANNVTDEFIKPIIITKKDGTPKAKVQDGDVVICFNFRTDRCREITMALTQNDFPDFGMHKLKLNYTTMTNYDKSFKNVNILFDKDNLPYTLGEILAGLNKTQVRIAETEKYPHVTFFFSGGREKEFKGEKRILINSPKVATYDLQPEMSAPEVKDAIINEMKTNKPDFICLNFANADMVGHTGVYKSILKAVETVDNCLKQVVETGEELGYSFIIIADHGNADNAINEDGSPNTAHSTNPVPIVLIDSKYHKIRNGILADVAPTILKLMEIPQPKEMTGNSLV